uniref:Uncharacterized protein n=1 Tax=Arundo donax TaxID=35708 RepID=A0A0A9HBG5_ARUDO
MVYTKLCKIGFEIAAFSDGIMYFIDIPLTISIAITQTSRMLYYCLKISRVLVPDDR